MWHDIMPTRHYDRPMVRVASVSALRCLVALALGCGLFGALAAQAGAHGASNRNHGA
jgi:hypothetical protein